MGNVDQNVLARRKPKNVLLDAQLGAIQTTMVFSSLLVDASPYTAIANKVVEGTVNARETR
jgi:hypothetical protein